MVNPQITVRSMALTVPIKDYAANKIAKYADILEKATNISIEITEFKPHTGVSQDFLVEVNVKVPGTFVRVAEKGEDVYALIDKVSDLMARQMKRYEDKFEFWQGAKSLKEIETEIEDSEIAEGNEDYADEYQVYMPEISKKSGIDPQPISAEEAIERMELANSTFWMFRNSETGEYAVVYKRGTGGYGLLEPEK